MPQFHGYLFLPRKAYVLHPVYVMGNIFSGIVQHVLKSNINFLPLLSSQVVRICSHWHSTGSTHPNCNWTTKFRSQRTSHMELSATITTVTGPVGARLHTGTEDAPVLDRPAPLRPPHNSDAAHKYTTLLTYLISCYFAGERYYVFVLWHMPSVCRL